MIYLIGFMGSGKSTIASRLAEKLQCSCIEMDESIEKQEGLTIPEMFAQHGESYFREKERDFLRSLEGEAVVSTGGGVILSKENCEMMREGTVIYLHAGWETIVHRLKNDTSRPLWSGDESEKKQRFEDRLKLYKEAAHHVVVVDDKAPEVIAEEIAARLK
ncbi:shikimate kinase [Halobacillus kuroshimensis]|uniref:shikimate kinase n=1 Tax=Halobacillus kuroshimensis TaxID=302481 RepID=UPI0004840A1D|nr:shikimate kinase [Halobacillus kuroshimensis]